MTCIIGCRTDQKIYIAGDSAGADDSGFGVSRGDTKVYKKQTNNGGLILGFSHSFRYGQLLKFKWDVPKYDESLDFEEYLHTDFIDSIYELMNENYLDDKNPSNKDLGVTIIGFKNQMFTLGEDLQIEKINKQFSDFLCIGCGSEIAYGAMEGLSKLEPKERMMRSLQIVSKYYSSSVRPPYLMESISIEE